MPVRAARYGLAVLALIVSAWFVIGALQAHDVNAATALLNNQAGTSAAATHRTDSLLSSASFLNPGVDVKLLRARLDMERHDYARAKVLVDQSVASEPNNVSAWISALQLALVDPSAEHPNQVIAHLRVIDPVDTRGITGR